MNAPMSFAYYIEQAKQQRLQQSEYTDVCLEALRIKAKNVKSLEVISQEMDKVYTSMLAYKLAYERGGNAYLDLSLQGSFRSMRKTLEGWVFPPNQIVRVAMEEQGVTPDDLPESFSVQDREYIVQCYGITFKAFCALPYVRPETKKHLFRVLAQAESLEQTLVMSQCVDFVCKDDKIVYPQNKLATFLLTGKEKGNVEDVEEVQRMLGKEMTFVV